jgi:hypothetical protein
MLRQANPIVAGQLKAVELLEKYTALDSAGSMDNKFLLKLEKDVLNHLYR